MDNFFPNPELLRHLSSKQIAATGTPLERHWNSKGKPNGKCTIAGFRYDSKRESRNIGCCN